MALPYFFNEQIAAIGEELVLDEDTSRHVVQVLRMKSGAPMHLTDGRGNLAVAELTGDHKKNCRVRVISSARQEPPERKCTIAVSLVKNAHRFEWFLEKATEIGVAEILPLICTRTEKQHFRMDRMKTILVGAMLQSQQTWLPFLQEPVKFSAFLKSSPPIPGAAKFIAHCETGEPRDQLASHLPVDHATILVGPEGDFTIDEIELALQCGFLPVALGNHRLRTETAALVAVTMASMARGNGPGG